MAGRPTKFNDARMNSICDALRDGCTRMSSVAATGISYQTFLQWLKEFPQFLEGVTRAEAEAENLYVSAINKAASPRKVIETVTTEGPDGTITKTTERLEFDWRAAESWLKRRRREVWGDTLDLRRIDDDTILRLLALEAGGDPQEPSNQ